MTRRPAFWIAYALLSAIALAVAWRLFPLAIPLVNLDITLSRSEALTRAEALAARLKLAPDEARSAVRFAHDSATQNYVELEGGGKAAFGDLVKGDLYAPYWWDVRVFKPGDYTCRSRGLAVQRSLPRVDFVCLHSRLESVFSF